MKTMFRGKENGARRPTRGGIGRAPPARVRTWAAKGGIAAHQQDLGGPALKQQMVIDVVFFNGPCRPAAAITIV